MAALVDYSSEEEGDQHAEREGKKRIGLQQSAPAAKKAKLPFPSALLGAPPATPPATTADGASSPAVDDKGRVRMFAHVAGNWATHAYVEVPVDEDMHAALQASLQAVAQHLPHKATVHFLDDSPLHLSVTKTVVLRHHEIDPFADMAARALSRIKRFHVDLCGLECFTNDLAVRSFVSMKVGTPHPNLLAIVAALDEVLHSFSQPPFYKDPRFHMSYGWWAGGHVLGPEGLQAVQKVLEEVGEGQCRVQVGAIRCKVGNRYFAFALAP